MDKPFVLVLFGPSGCGKDTIKNELLKYGEYNEVKRFTTRPKRTNNAEEYNFLTDEEYDAMDKENIIEKVCYNNWHYGSHLDDYDLEKLNVITGDQSVARQLTSSDKVHALAIKLEVSDKERLIRQLSRENEPWIEEIFRRYYGDKRDYGLLLFPHTRVNNEYRHKLQDTVEEIRELNFNFFLDKTCSSWRDLTKS